MKRMIVFLGMICMATSAMAFGGGGGGHDSTKYNRYKAGVDNFGVHIHPDNPPLDIRFYDIKDDANAQPCQAGANVYCCKAGYVVDVATSKCVACPSGSVATLEENFKCTVCVGEMMPNQDKSSCIMPEPICEGTVCGANCCPTGATCTEGKCCYGETCAGEGQELYCAFTNAQGECESWSTCAEGKSTGASIVGVKSEYDDGCYGACAGERQELYCASTNAQGECYDWYICAEGKSSGDSIVGVSGAYGACAGAGEELYCSKTNESGECLSWGTCDEGKSSKDWIVNLDSRKGAEDMWAAGACAGENEEVYCAHATAMGECYEWLTCAEGRSTKDWIVDVKYNSGALGACADENERYYCSGKISTGECFNWVTCPADRFDETTQTCN